MAGQWQPASSSEALGPEETSCALMATPDWAALPPELLTRIGRFALQQAGGENQLTQAARFASVCKAFRAATCAQDCWLPDLELLWCVWGTPISAGCLLARWAPFFQGMWLDGLEGSSYLPAQPKLLPRADARGRSIFVTVREPQQQGNVRVLTDCLTLAHHFGASAASRIHCHGMGPGDLQLLAGLRTKSLQLYCSSGLTLDALPADDRILVSIRIRAAKSELAAPMRVSWAVMTAASSSSFQIFEGVLVVSGYSPEPQPAAYVEVCISNADDAASVQGLPLADMRAGVDGWRSSQWPGGCGRTVFARGPDNLKQ